MLLLPQDEVQTEIAAVAKPFEDLDLGFFLPSVIDRNGYNAYNCYDTQNYVDG